MRCPDSAKSLLLRSVGIIIVFLTVGSIAAGILMNLPHFVSAFFSDGTLLIEQFLKGAAKSAFVALPLTLLAALLFLLPLWLARFGVNTRSTGLARALLSKGIFLGVLAGVATGIALLTQFAGGSNEFSTYRIPGFLFMLAVCGASGAASGYVIEKIICPEKAT